jgi:hypothetical protein
VEQTIACTFDSVRYEVPYSPSPCITPVGEHHHSQFRGNQFIIENGNPSSKTLQIRNASIITLTARIACEHRIGSVFVAQPSCPLPLSFCLATIHYSSYDTLDQACPAPAIYTAHSCPGPAVPCRATACPCRPSLALSWALERGSREMKGRRQLSTNNNIPHNIAATAWSAILPCDSSRMVVGRLGLIPDTTSTKVE